jgi:hypothetical protein
MGMDRRTSVTFAPAAGFQCLEGAERARIGIAEQRAERPLLLRF